MAIMNSLFKTPRTSCAPRLDEPKKSGYPPTPIKERYSYRTISRGPWPRNPVFPTGLPLKRLVDLFYASVQRHDNGLGLRAPLELQRALVQGARTDRGPQRHAQQVGVVEFDARRLVAVVVQDAEAALLGPPAQ